ncbi:MAG: hypothetical protein D6830_03120 [Ignavibacteria bacterium]|nr:MAG: hypothetical protein D6830_03120 [Ignavibacteria bacterium]
MTEKEFELYWIEKIKGERKNFPSDFINSSDCEIFDNGGNVLTIGGEFFGNYEIVDVHGKVVAQASDYNEAKYYIYSSLTKPDTIPIPRNNDAIKAAVKEYEKYLDELIHLMKKDFEKNFPESKGFMKASNYIFNSLKLHRY